MTTRPGVAVSTDGLASTTAQTTIAELYDEHHRNVYALALRYGGGQVSWAEDVTHDVFIKLMETLPRLEDKGDLGGWLYRVTTNRCLNRLRNERFRRSALVRWLFGLEPPQSSSPESIAGARVDLKRAMELLADLPPKQRIAFSAYYLDGKPQTEIGAIMGHSKGYVSKLISRAEEKIRAAGWDVEPPRKEAES